MFRALIAGALAVTLVACTTPSTNNGRPGDGTVVIRMNNIGVDKVQFRHLDAVNAIRQARGLGPVALNAQLIRSAQENVSETFEDDFNTLEVWMRDSFSASVILDPNARDIGIAWHQDRNGKLWWVQIVGG